MSEWRSRVPTSEWRFVRRPGSNPQHPHWPQEIVYSLQAKVWSGAWQEFGRIDMDCAAKGWGETVARMIVAQHNNALAVERALSDCYHAQKIVPHMVEVCRKLCPRDWPPVTDPAPGEKQ